jgi:hypothetical protein
MRTRPLGLNSEATAVPKRIAADGAANKNAQNWLCWRPRNRASSVGRDEMQPTKMEGP